jgi:predicted amidohydrolase
MTILEKAVEKYLAFRTGTQIVERYLSGRNIKATSNCSAIQLKQVRVATTQIPLTLVKDPLEWVELLHRHTAEAAAAGAQLVVFPENITLPLLGLIPGVRKLAAQQAGSASELGGSSGLEPARVFRIFGSGVESFYRQTMSSLAAKYQIYIMGGSRLVPDHTGRLMNIASLYGPQGQLIGSQAKAHLLPLEAGWGICRGNELKVFNTPLGNIAFPICMDATYFETFRILSYLGADLIIIPIANPEEYNQWKALRGIWPRVQESYVYGVKSALVGKNFFGLDFTGKAGIFAPIELHPQNGVLALAHNPHKEDLVIADLDIEKLRETRTGRPYGGDINLNLYRRYFPQVYST